MANSSSKPQTQQPSHHKEDVGLEHGDVSTASDSSNSSAMGSSECSSGLSGSPTSAAQTPLANKNANPSIKKQRAEDQKMRIEVKIVPPQYKDRLSLYDRLLAKQPPKKPESTNNSKTRQQQRPASAIPIKIKHDTHKQTNRRATNHLAPSTPNSTPTPHSMQSILQKLENLSTTTASSSSNPRSRTSSGSSSKSKTPSTLPATLETLLKSTAPSSTTSSKHQTNNEEPSTTGPESLLDTSSSSETSTAAPSRTHSRSDSWHQVSVPTFAPPLQQHQQQQPASNNATSKLSKLTLIIPKHGIAFTPPIDLIETATEFHLFVDVPGAHVGDVEVRMEEWGKVVVVRAGVEDPVEAFKDKMITNTNSIHERKVGEFMRRVKLSTAVDEKDCEASMLNGLLHVRMGKKGKSSG
ncbi:hypothetical protein HDU79_011345 [Rhizoclosmatium sp. JEL0117]|nr:hypothetical protein HDU79_011345 [Rhizoclosmatium sp. JEL0117]